MAQRDFFTRGWLSENLFAAVSPARTGMRLKKSVDVEIVRQALAHLDGGVTKLSPGWFWAMVVRAIWFTSVRRRQIVELRWG